MSVVPGPPASAAPPATALRARRCLRHSTREAVARCPACSGSFCRECVSEHGGRLICADCLARELAAAAKPVPKKRLKRLRRAMGFAAGVLLTWILFYALGSLLLRIPSDFHEGTVWKSGFEKGAE